jgi:hypothetical protein
MRNRYFVVETIKSGYQYTGHRLVKNERRSDLENRVHSIAEVIGSSPLPPICSSVYINEELPLRSLLEVLLGSESKLKSKTEKPLFLGVRKGRIDCGEKTLIL